MAYKLHHTFAITHTYVRGGSGDGYTLYPFAAVAHTSDFAIVVQSWCSGFDRCHTRHYAVPITYGPHIILAACVSTRIVILVNIHIHRNGGAASALPNAFFFGQCYVYISKWVFVLLPSFVTDRYLRCGTNFKLRWIHHPRLEVITCVMRRSRQLSALHYIH